MPKKVSVPSTATSYSGSRQGNLFFLAYATAVTPGKRVYRGTLEHEIILRWIAEANDKQLLAYFLSDQASDLDVNDYRYATEDGYVAINPAETLLTYACKQDNNNPAIVLIMHTDADVTATNASGESPLSILLNKRLVNYLVVTMLLQKMLMNEKCVVSNRDLKLAQSKIEQPALSPSVHESWRNIIELMRACLATQAVTEVKEHFEKKVRFAANVDYRSEDSEPSTPIRKPTPALG